MEQELNTTTMHISDATNMFRAPVPKNSKPYDEQVIKFNNNLVDTWGETMLCKIGTTDGKVLASKVYPAWVIFATGVESKSFDNHFHQGSFASVSREAVDYWINAFKNGSPTELCALGVNTVQCGWDTLNLAMRIEQTRLKNEQLFLKSDDPVVWSSTCNANHKLAFDKTLPFDLTQEDYMDMREKYTSVMRNLPKLRS
jgi:hypothetical protein